MIKIKQKERLIIIHINSVMDKYGILNVEDIDLSKISLSEWRTITSRDTDMTKAKGIKTARVYRNFNPTKCFVLLCFSVGSLCK